MIGIIYTNSIILLSFRPTTSWLSRASSNPVDTRFFARGYSIVRGLPVFHLLVQLKEIRWRADGGYDDDDTVGTVPNHIMTHLDRTSGGEINIKRHLIGEASWLYVCIPLNMHRPAGKYLQREKTHWLALNEFRFGPCFGSQLDRWRRIQPSVWRSISHALCEYSSSRLPEPAASEPAAFVLETFVSMLCKPAWNIPYWLSLWDRSLVLGAFEWDKRDEFLDPALMKVLGRFESYVAQFNNTHIYLLLGSLLPFVKIWAQDCTTVTHWSVFLFLGVGPSRFPHIWIGTGCMWGERACHIIAMLLNI